MTKQITGSFQIIAWDEKPYAELEGGAKLTSASVKQSYSGGIEGTSVVEYLMVHRADQTATFVGHELITGSIEGRNGSFIIQHNGTFKNGIAKSKWVIVSSSGTGALLEISGQGSFVSGEQGRADYLFTSSV